MSEEDLKLLVLQFKGAVAEALQAQDRRNVEFYELIVRKLNQVDARLAALEEKLKGA